MHSEDFGASNMIMLNRAYVSFVHLALFDLMALVCTEMNVLGS